MIILLGICFLYGIFHAIGPGHGKAIIASFFFKEKHPLKKSIIMSIVVSLTHTGSAVILAFLLYYILTGIRGMMRIQIQSYFVIASGLLVTVIGVTFLVKKLFFEKKDKENDKSFNNRNIYLVGISAGIIPCPVTLMIMTLAISRNITLIGLASVMSISLGMFIVLVIVGLISIFSRKKIMSFSGKIMKKTETLSTIIEYASILAIIVIGITMSTNIFGLI